MCHTMCMSFSAVLPVGSFENKPYTNQHKPLTPSTTCHLLKSLCLILYLFLPVLRPPYLY